LPIEIQPGTAGAVQAVPALSYWPLLAGRGAGWYPGQTGHNATLCVTTR